MQRHAWSRLNRQQLGTYAEYFVKMELTMYGFEVYGTEVDDRGIDFIARWPGDAFIEIQVKSLRATGYVFMPKDKFTPRPSLYLAFVRFEEGRGPDLYLIPSMEWPEQAKAGGLFADRSYEGLQSAPEWGLNISRKHLPDLARYGFDTAITKLCKH